MLVALILCALALIVAVAALFWMAETGEKRLREAREAVAVAQRSAEASAAAWRSTQRQNDSLTDQLEAERQRGYLFTRLVIKERRRERGAFLGVIERQSREAQTERQALVRTIVAPHEQAVVMHPELHGLQAMMGRADLHGISDDRDELDGDMNAAAGFPVAAPDAIAYGHDRIEEIRARYAADYAAGPEPYEDPDPASLATQVDREGA